MKKYQFLLAALFVFLFAPLVPSVAFANVGGGGGALCITTGGTTLCSSYSQSINLSPGWNIVSTPRILLTHSFSAAETSTNFDIYVLDASQTAGWATMAQEGQTEFTPLSGYFIDNKTGTNQTLTFNYLASTTPNQQLFSKTFSTPGWYSIGVANATYALPVGTAASVDTNNPAKIFNALTGFYNNAVDFTDSLFSTNPDAVGVGNAWKAVVPSDINTLNDFRETKGYALYLSQANGEYNGFQNSNIPQSVMPVVTSFNASPSSIIVGASSTLAWSVKNAITVSIDNTIGIVSAASTSVAPTTTTMYTLTATNAYGTATSSVSVTVNPVPQTGTLAVATDSSSPSYALVSGGTTGVTAAVIKLHAANEAVNLQKIGFVLTSGAPADVVQTYVYAGNNIMTTSGTAVAAGTLLGTATFTGNNTSATSTLNTTVQLPNNTDATLIIKSDIADIGTSQPGTEGDLVAVNYLNSQGVGASTANTVYGSSLNGSGTAGVRTFNTIPTVALDTTLPSTGVADGRLMEFKLMADSHGNVGLNKVTFTIATTTAIVTNLQLFVYSDSGYSSAVSGSFGASTGQFGNIISSVSGAPFTFTATTNPFEAGAGSTYYFKLVGSISNVQVGSSVVTTLKGDSSFDGMKTAANVSGNLIWSPNATTTAATNQNDWTNSNGVTGLPASGIFQTRSN